MRPQQGDVAITVANRSVVRLQQSRNDVEEGCFARTIRPDQCVHGARRDHEGKVIDGDKAGEPAGNGVDLKQCPAHPTLRIRNPRIPLGRNITTSTMIRPLNTSRKSCRGRSTSGSALRTNAPRTGPSGVVAPPRMAKLRIVTAVSKPYSFGLMNEEKCALRAPASPAKAADMTRAANL